MGYYLSSIGREYDHSGNYIGNSDSGNKFHGVSSAAPRDKHKVCLACGALHVDGNCTQCPSQFWKYSYRRQYA